MGTRFGAYELAFELGSGGMATVYLARSSGTGGVGRTVALKRIHPHLAKQPEFVDMFLDEAGLVSRLQHPYLCSVYEFGEVDGTYYLAMEYLRGETLSRMVRRLQSMPEEAAHPELPYVWARVLADLCDGLHAAHQTVADDGGRLELIHRDISPQNLFVCDDGTVRVLDFGVARARGRRVQTSTGEVKGKLAYLAPEQIRRQPLDHRVDIWALGVVAWEVFTRRRLFRRDSEVDTMMAVAQDDIPLPSRVNRRLPVELDAVVMRALEREPDDRYGSARELGRALRAFSLSAQRPIDEGDVEAWMGRLFSEARIRRRHLLEIAAQGAGTVPRAHDTERLISDSSSTATAADLSPRVEPRLSSSKSWLLVAGLVVIGATVTAWLALWSLSEETSAMDGESSSVPAIAGGHDASTPDAAVLVDGGRDDAVGSADAALDASEDLADSIGETTERATTTKARGSGVLRVITPGTWAEVLIDGRARGHTLLTEHLPVGRHRVELRPQGDAARAIRRTVRIRRGGTVVLRETFP